MNDGYRKAALKLHTMSTADRAWMLQRLEPEERERLSDLLKELRELGIRADQCMSDHLSSHESLQGLTGSAREQAEVGCALDALCVADLEKIIALLLDEPDYVAAAVLSAYSWPWRARFLAECGEERRQRLGRALRGGPGMRPRARAELISLLAERLAAMPDQNAHGRSEFAGGRAAAGGRVVSGSFWQGLRRWLP